MAERRWSEDAPPEVAWAQQRSKRDEEYHIEQAALMRGHLFHPSIPEGAYRGGAIAELVCSTGIWIKEVANRYYRNVNVQPGPLPCLVGFDALAHQFHPQLEPGVQMVTHDCSQPFESRWHAKFDVVNIQNFGHGRTGHEGRLRSIVANALRLLRPGGYLQWRGFEISNVNPVPPIMKLAEMQSTIDRVWAHRKYVKECDHLFLVESDTANPISLPNFMLSMIRGLRRRDHEGRSGGVSEQAFRIITLHLVESGTFPAIKAVGADVSLEMRNIILRDVLIVSQTAHLDDLIEMRSEPSVERAVELHAHMREMRSVQERLGQLEDAGLDVFRIECLHPLIVAQKL